MSNKRELIVQNMLDELRDMRDPKPIVVTRETIDHENLARSQYPAIYITTENETRDALSLLGSSGSRFASIFYNVTCYVTGANLDRQRNDIIERVEETLVGDVTRSGTALDTQVTEILVNNDVEPPQGEVTITVRVDYQYTRGQL